MISAGAGTQIDPATITYLKENIRSNDDARSLELCSPEDAPEITLLLLVFYSANNMCEFHHYLFVGEFAISEEAQRFEGVLSSIFHH